jgi:hypothetical protein
MIPLLGFAVLLTAFGTRGYAVTAYYGSPNTATKAEGW